MISADQARAIAYDSSKQLIKGVSEAIEHAASLGRHSCVIDAGVICGENTIEKVDSSEVLDLIKDELLSCGYEFRCLDGSIFITWSQQ